MNQITLYNIALTMIPRIGPILAKYLISYCGSAEEVFKSNSKALNKIPNIGHATINQIKNSDTLDLAKKQLEYLDKIGGEAISFHDSNYPRRLKHFESCPVVIYTKGKMEMNHQRTVAIVGTRKPTNAGKIQCEKIIDGLKPYGVQIISGLAFGVDTCAHTKSVNSEIETIGVLGHGLDRLYPSSNINLVSRMVKKGGLLTEFPIHTNPDRENFPMRNRIIAAMSDVVIVVESKRKGGSIITAEFANSFNKDVFALPGRVDDETSEGCNKLIKQHKAHLLESAADVGYIMRWETLDKKEAIQQKLFVDLNPDEQKVVDVMKISKEITVDELHHNLQMPHSELASILLNLEFSALIKSLPGKKYILV